MELMFKWGLSASAIDQEPPPAGRQRKALVVFAQVTL